MRSKEGFVVENVSENKKEYSALRYAWGSFLAFFGISSKTHNASKKRAKLVGDIVTYIVLIAGGFLMAYPFWWMLAGSFANAYDTSTSNQLSAMIWWPSNSLPATAYPMGVEQNRHLFWNYYELFTSAMNSSQGNLNIVAGYTYWRAVLNNLIYSIVPVVVGVITSASAAFAFAKINWKGRDVVFMFLLAAIMVPGPSIMTTQFAMYTAFGWLEPANQWMTLTIPGMFGAIMTAFFIRQFLYGLPTSIIEAAKIDGAGYFRIFCSFILPLAMPAIVAQGLLSFMGCWNNYMGSLIYTTPTSSLWVNLPHAMVIMNTSNSGNQGPVMAAAVMCVLPVIILFAIFQKMIIGSLMLTGSKE